MGETVLYVVSGAPGTGKTSIGRRLASHLHVPTVGVHRRLWMAEWWTLASSWGSSPPAKRSRPLKGSTCRDSCRHVGESLRNRHVPCAGFQPRRAFSLQVGLARQGRGSVRNPRPTHRTIRNKCRPFRECMRSRPNKSSCTGFRSRRPVSPEVGLGRGWGWPVPEPSLYIGRSVGEGLRGRHR